MKRNAKLFCKIAYNKRMIHLLRPKLIAAKQTIKDMTRALVTDLMNDSDIEDGDIIGDEILACSAASHQ